MKRVMLALKCKVIKSTTIVYSLSLAKYLIGILAFSACEGRDILTCKNLSVNTNLNYYTNKSY